MTDARHLEPLASTLERLDSTDEWCRYVAGEPDDRGWTSLDRLVEDLEPLRSWFDALVAGDAHGHPDVAASYLASWLSGAVLEGVTTALRSEQRAWPLFAHGLLVHRHDDGWIDGVAVLATTVRVLPDDPDAGHPRTQIVEDLAAMRRLVAREAVAILEPIYDRLRTWAPFGKAGMWGTAADVVGGSAVWAARRAGEDGRRAFEDAGGILDELAVLVPQLRVRPVLVEVPWFGGVAALPRKGTCCLWYKTQADPDPCGDGYCSSCPLREPVSQVERWSRWLEEQEASR